MIDPNDDNRYGEGVPYDDVLDEDGNVVIGPSVEEVLASEAPAAE